MITYNPKLNDWWFACELGQHFLSGRVAHDEDGAFYAGIFIDD